MRLSLALESGAAVLPDTGQILVFRPDIDADLSLLDRARTVIVQGFRPAYDHWQAAGFSVQPELDGTGAAAIVFLPRAKAEGRDLIARALAATGGGPVILDGPKTHGIDSMIRALRKAGAAMGEVIAKAHGKLVTINGGDLTGWATGPGENQAGFVTAPGTFSADAIDPGSAALIAALPDTLGGRVADLGAGWGYLSAALLATHAKITECHLVEAEYAALEAARLNVTDPRAHFHWADVARFDAVSGLDHIVTNPPFHTSRAADPDLGRTFISAAARLLAPHGTLWLVANRHLPYESEIRGAFSIVAELEGTGAFKVMRAERPRTGRTKTR